jgi:chemosensory pili system protein ChpC
VIESAPSELRTVVLPTGTADVILPSIAMAEVISYQDPTPYRNAPGWLLGAITWRGCNVPLLSLEVEEMTPSEPIRSRRPRVVICYTPSGNRALPYLGFRTIGLPRVARANAQVLAATPLVSENPFVLHGLTLSGRPGYIPDMDAIERAVLEFVQS